MASSSAITTRIVTWGPFDGQPPIQPHPEPARAGHGQASKLIEELVLAGLELGDLVDDVLAVAAHRVHVAAGVDRLVRPRRTVGDERPHVEVVGVVGEVGELLVDRAQLVAERAQPMSELERDAARARREPMDREVRSAGRVTNVMPFHGVTALRGG